MAESCAIRHNEARISLDECWERIFYQIMKSSLLRHWQENINVPIDKRLSLQWNYGTESVGKRKTRIFGIKQVDNIRNLNKKMV